jgi:anti-anti-sigma regulatory factor
MEFKIDTKSSYILITPVFNHLDANLTAGLRQKCRELTENGRNNFIIDLHNCLDADSASFAGLAEMHEDLYSNEQSLVFTNIQAPVLQALKAEEMDTAINVAPTMIEAVDIVSMEVLERDLFGEED